MPNPDSGPDIGPDQNGEGQGNPTTPPVLVPIFLTVKEIAPSPASVLAISTEPLLFHISAQNVDGAYLSPNEIATIGLEITFVEGAQAPADDASWFPLTVTDRLIGGVYTAAWLLIGPEAPAGLGLAVGVYERFVRAKTPPHIVRKAAPLTIVGPNPS